MMNNSQRKVLYMAATVLSIMLMFPPYTSFLSDGIKVGAGYSFILGTTPQAHGITASIDIMTLGIQYIFVVTVCYFIWLSLKGDK